MNTERLYSITKELKRELDVVKTVGKIGQLGTHLQEAIDTPNEATLISDI